MDPLAPRTAPLGASDGAGGPWAGGTDPVRRRTRDRRGRGARGPGVLRTPSAPPQRTARHRFDELVLDVVRAVEERWHDELGLVEYAVEDTPLVPDDWDDTVPLASLVRGSGGTPTRLVLFRRPIEHRCQGREELRALVLTVLVEQVAELLGRDPDEVDPRL
ncbi:metallopeptidase family protein [Nocardioides solisilvae]|uniref:metallopeptidase family protein n=1 Tax=Nocardioides solisilvae TaxID=1542435 RepID=UPI000D74745D|nr:metallopeptidase family protein [Nocardioides solisilvae]